MTDEAIGNGMTEDWYTFVLAALETIAERLDTCDIDFHSQDLRDQMRRRTAERLYVARLAVAAQLSPNVITPDRELAELAAHCWQAAAMLVDTDPESIERQRGAAALTDPDQAEAGVPAPEDRSPFNAAPQVRDLGVDSDEIPY